MKTTLMTLALALWAAAAPAQVHLDILDEPVDLDRYGATAPRVASGSDSVSDALMLPHFEAAPGVSTLYSVRNEVGRPLRVRALYLDPYGAELAREEFDLAPRATWTRNLRDVAGVGPDARGMAILGALGDRGELLSGDYFLIDQREGRSTGGALINISQDDPGNEMCGEWGARLIGGDNGFGGRTRLRLVADWPAGGAAYDPPTAVGTVYGEDGAPLRSFEVRTNAHAFELDAADLLPPGVAFGSLELRFLGAPGAALVEHSGGDGLSIALKASCRGAVR